MEWHSRIVTWL